MGRTLSTNYFTRGIYNNTSTTTLTGVKTDVSLAGTGIGSRTLPEFFFDRVGKALRVRLCGVRTTGAIPGNATVTVKFGSTTYVTTGSFGLDGSMTNKIWIIEGVITCRSLGSSGTLSGNMYMIHSEQNATQTAHIQDMPVPAPITVNLTQPLLFDVLWTCDNAATVISCTCFGLWAEFF